MNFKTNLIILVVLSALSVSAGAESITQCDRKVAHEADTSRPIGVEPINYSEIVAKEAIEICISDIKKRGGLPRLKYLLGRAYEKDGNKESAFKWYLNAAEEGYPFGQRATGKMYNNGRGVKKDYKKALYWYKKADENGSHMAVYDIGEMYEYGEGMPKNEDAAHEYFLRSGKSGNKWAIRKLCYNYQNGVGVIPDINHARYWCRKSMALGDSFSKKDYERLQKGFLTEAEENAKKTNVSSKQKESTYDPCKHLYTGKTFDAKGGVFGINQRYEVLGYSAKTGKATITQPYDRSFRQEVYCSSIPD